MNQPHLPLRLEDRQGGCTEGVFVIAGAQAAACPYNLKVIALA